MCRSLHSIHDPYALSHTFSRSLCVCLLRGLFFLLCCCMNAKRREHTHLFSSPDFAAAADSVCYTIFPNFHSLSLARAALIAERRVALHPTSLYLFSAISFRTSTRWKLSKPCVCSMAALNAAMSANYFMNSYEKCASSTEESEKHRQIASPSAMC